MLNVSFNSCLIFRCFSDRQVYEHSIKIMKLRDKMVMCLDYLCRRNQPGTWKKKILGVLATVRELHAASKDFNNVL